MTEKPTVEVHPDGSATVTLPEGYLGTCTRCMEAEATHQEWLVFAEPVRGGQKVWTEDEGLVVLPDVEGVWVGVCDSCRSEL